MTAIVILALVALFIGLRLYSVLGERTGHEQQQPILKPADAEARIDARAPAAQPASQSSVDPAELAYVPTAGPGVRAILSADPSFDVARFLEGAQAAYRMILEAFWKGDLSGVSDHVDPHVLETFEQAVADRQSAGHVIENRLVAIEQSVIASADLSKSVATVAVRFEADIAAVTKDAEGQVIAGSMSDAVQTRDLWTFRRDIASRDPNWVLIETDEDQ